MCGIVGFVSREKNTTKIEKFLERVSHRGPDQLSYKIIKVKNYYLHIGSARLSIVGLNDGDMPMMDSLGNILSYNGEIYELEKYNINNLNTKSDTRVLLNFLKEFHLNKLKELNGMFAFSYFDNIQKKLFLARDSLGIKPLYYFKSKDFPIVFSSELKSLSLFMSDQMITSEDKIQELIYLGKNSKDSTLVNNIISLEPASYLEFDFKNILKQPYESPFSYLNNKKNNSENFETVFLNSLEDQLTADVPIDILLSGGIDSSSIAIATKKYLNRDVNAFNLSYANKKYDENSNANLIASDLNINLKTFHFKTEDNESTIEELVQKLPEPILDPSIVGTYYLSKEVSKYTKSVISGDGADELFGGYTWHKLYLIPKFLNIFINDFTTSKIQTFNKFSENYITFGEKLELYSFIKNLTLERKILYIQNHLLNSKNEIDEISELHETYIKELELINTDPKDKIRELDMKSYLYTNILKKSDTASMLNGLEIRPIFLDNRMIKYGLNTPIKNTLNILNSKVELRKIVSKFNADIGKAKKHGFPHDFGNWTTNVGINYLQTNWSNLKIVDDYLDAIRERNISDYQMSRGVWKLYSVLKWLEVNKVKII